MGFCSAVCTSTARLDGKTAIITGSNTGIGKETAKDFFKRGARVIMACRSTERANQAADDIKNACQTNENLGELIVQELDLTSLTSVRKCVKQILEKESRIDLLVNNAGISVCPASKTEDGFELQFGTNHLGHFLFTLLLIPKILQSPSARIVNVSSAMHERGSINFEDLNWEKKPYSPMRAYGQSKLANVLFAKELAERLKENDITHVTAYTLHPGAIQTDLMRNAKEVYGRVFTSLLSSFAWTLKTPEQGAQTTIYCSVDEKCAHESGLYYAECAVTTPSKAARNEHDAQTLWEESLKLVGLPYNYDPFKMA